MARIATYNVKADDTEVKEIFAEIEGSFGMVPNLFKTYAQHLPLLRANWNKVKAVMGEGTLSHSEHVFLLKEGSAPLPPR
ncbi:MAG: hypothetical protein U1D97_16090 [Desulfuromonadales bacterium]|nr:hypothetical protein [Desulfuromonadales bacterium]